MSPIADNAMQAMYLFAFWERKWDLNPSGAQMQMETHIRCEQTGIRSPRMHVNASNLLVAGIQDQQADEILSGLPQVQKLAKGLWPALIVPTGSRVVADGQRKHINCLLEMSADTNAHKPGTRAYKQDLWDLLKWFLSVEVFVWFWPVQEIEIAQRVVDDSEAVPHSWVVGLHLLSLLIVGPSVVPLTLLKETVWHTHRVRESSTLCISGFRSEAL